MRGELTATVSVIISDVVKPFSELTESEIEKFKNNAAERLSSSMSRYFSQHANEYQKV
ncbi:MAG: hypothetical protein NC213_08040 [Acetobacter sp.]|nr:hypothetical protein [Bacteroides sp.]MCM1341679.1 hypothetical protein [Acetobacter sp.]MCM1434272.1 hypothetical protein [Clostridiales bacterium]